PYPGFANARLDVPGSVGGATGPATERCVAACETLVALFRCPSAGLPEHVYGPSYEDWIVQKRVPTSYAVCGSGVKQRLLTAADANNLDGAFQHEHSTQAGFVGTRLPITSIIDGTSNTIFVGEEAYDLKTVYDVSELDLPGVARRKAVWQFGSDSIDCQYGMN